MTKAEKLYRKLKEHVIECAPGTPFISFRAIMTDYSVSQATVTAAVRRLVEEKLLLPNARREMLVTEEVLKYRHGALPVICLALPHWQSDWYTFAEHHFFDLASELGYELEVLRFNWQDSVPQELQKLKGKLDAVVLVYDVEMVSAELIRQMNAHQMPYVFFARDMAGVAVNCVALDNEYSGARAAHHLIEQGHQRLAVVISQPRTEGIASRIKGFQQFCDLNGVSVEIIDCGITSGDFAPARVYETLQGRYKSRKPEFTGLFTLCEDSAMAIYRFCSEAGIRIPHDLSVISIGQSWRLDYYTPPLTSIGTNVGLMVRETVRIIKNNLAASEPLECERKLVRPDFFIRESTAACPGFVIQELIAK